MVGLQISGPLQDWVCEFYALADEESSDIYTYQVYAYCKKNDINPNAPIFSKTTWRFPKNPEISEKWMTSPEPPSSLVRRRSAPGPPQRQATNKSTKSNKSLSHDSTKALPEYRLPLTLPFGLLVPIGLFVYGWGAEKKVHWIVPNIGSALFAIGLIICFNCAQAYVVDTYTTYAASATGAAAFVRTMAGFSFPLFAPKLYDSLGVGVGNSVLGGISLFLGVVAPIAMWRFGALLRKHSTYCSD